MCCGKVKAEDGVDGTARKAWKQIVQRERGKRVQTYRQLTLGKTSIWNKWRHALPHGERLGGSGVGALASDSAGGAVESANAARVARISIRIFELLRRAKVLQPILATPTCGGICAQRRCCMPWDGIRSTAKSDAEVSAGLEKCRRGGRARIGNWWLGRCASIAGRNRR